MPSVIRGNDDFESDDLDFTIIYPNGGTEASPANVSPNSRYVEANPLPGHDVICVAEVLYNSEWGKSPYTAYSSTSSIGLGAFQIDSGDVVVKTGSANILGGYDITAGPWSSTANTASLPCRVKVWKVKGATV